MRRAWLAFGLALSLVSSSAVPALAQRTLASIRGTVVDASGAIVPGVTITVENQETGLVRTTVTNDSGIYVVSDLPVGQYRVSAELSGFKTGSRTGVTLRVADDYVADFELEPGAITEVVAVAASATPVKLLGGDVSGVITGEQVRELPLNGRNFLQLATLMPGVSAPDFLNVKDKGLLGGSDLSVSGSDVTANLWTVDGTNNNDVGSNRTILVYPSLEAIEEFKILRNSYGPEFGQSGGGQINIVTRAGGNQYNGSVFYSGRSDVFNATNYFLEQSDQPKEELTRNDFGGTFGGPLLRDRLFFFGALEWNIEDRGSVRAALVPTEAERSGDFSGPVIPGCTLPAPVDPLTGQPFAGNRIPADRLSAGGLSLLNLYPLPSVAPASGSCNTWVTSLTSPIRYNQQNVRADWNASSAARVLVRYTHDAWKNNSPNVQTNLWGDDPFPAVDSDWDQPSQSFTAQLNQTIGARATNSLQFSYSANEISVDRGGVSPELNDDIVSRIPSVFPLDSKAYGADTGHPVFWGGSGYEALWNEAPFRNNQDLFVLKDDYTRVFGKHLVKAGALVSFNKKNEDSTGNGSAENSQFWGSAGLPANSFVGTGNLLADFLLKDMSWGFSEVSSQRQVPQRWRDVEAYVADSWQVSPQVTLDYGVRYSLFLNPYAADDRIMSFVPELFDPALGNDACNGLVQAPDQNFCEEAGFVGATPGPNRSLVEQDTNNFAPRAGAAWDVFGDGKTAVRGGVGLFYLRERLSPGLNIAANPPFVNTLTGARLLDSSDEPCEGCFAESSGVPASGRERRAATPYNWQWNATLQREVWRNTTVEIGYVANYGYDLLRSHDANQVRAGDINGNGISDRLEYARSQPADTSLQPFGVFGDGEMNFWDHTGESTYHSLQTQFISRFGRGSEFQTSYTLARSRANVPLDNSSGGIAADVANLDLDNPDADWGRPQIGRTHIFNASLVYLAPSLDGRARLVRYVLGDWQLGTIVGAASGAPFTVYTGSIPGLNGGPSGTGYTDNQRPNRTSEPCKATSGPKEQIINPAAFTLDGFQLGSIGNEERGECTGRGFFQVDLSFSKNFSIGGGVRLQLRWDIFNAFNNTNFLGAASGLENVLNPSAVVLNSADPATATAITSATIPVGFGQATRARDPRQMQFGLKITW